MTDDELSVAYYAAKGNYEAANTCNRVEMRTKFLVAEGAVRSFGIGWIGTWSTSGNVIHPDYVARTTASNARRLSGRDVRRPDTPDRPQYHDQQLPTDRPLGVGERPQSPTSIQGMSVIRVSGWSGVVGVTLPDCSPPAAAGSHGDDHWTGRSTATRKPTAW